MVWLCSVSGDGGKVMQVRGYTDASRAVADVFKVHIWFMIVYLIYI